MANDFVWQPNNSATAFDVFIPERGFHILRLLAPPGTPTEPGDWIDVDTTDFPPVPTSLLSATRYMDVWPNAVDPDDSLTLTGPNNDFGQSTSFSEATLDCYPFEGEDNLYYEVGLTTLSLRALTAGVAGTAVPLPNQHGPELDDASIAGFIWHINGAVTYFALDETDPAAAQLADAVVKFAIVPDDLVEVNTSNGTLQYQWKDYPTRDTLAGLHVIATHTPPAPAPGDWSGTSGDFRQAAVHFAVDVEPPSSSLVDGQVHVGYWIERVSQADRSFSTQYSSFYSVTHHNTLASDPDGPISFAYSVADSSGFTEYSTATFQPDVAGYWQKTGEDVWLASLGSAAGARFFFTAAIYQMYIFDSHYVRWQFKTVSDNTFGVAVLIHEFDSTLVVTPDAIVLSDSTGIHTLATHSSAFTNGDTADVFIDFFSSTPGVTVYKNSVQVSTTTFPTGYDVDTTFYAPAWWASTANAGNVITGLEDSTIPTDRGDVGIQIDMDAWDFATPSTFEADSATVTRFRWLYPIGYPRAYEEPDPGNGLGATAAKMWVKLNFIDDVTELFMGTQNPEATDDPSLPFSEYQVAGIGAGTVYFKRDDGELIVTQDGTSHGGRSGVGGSPRAAPQFIGDPVNMNWVTDEDGRFLAIDSVLMASKHLPVYMVFGLEGTSAAPQDWWSGPWMDVWFYAKPRGRMPTPLIWHWGPDDDHNGLQDEGYTHNPVPLTTALPSDTVADGIAIIAEESYEDWTYSTRMVVVGYNDDVGAFIYGSVSPWNAQFDEFGQWGSQDYDYGVSDDSGRLYNIQSYNGGWAWFHPTIAPITIEDFTTLGSSHVGGIPTAVGDGGRSQFPTIQWVRDATVVGLHCTGGPTTTDCLYMQSQNLFSQSVPQIVYEAVFTVSSASGGLFFWWDNASATETYVKASNSQLTAVTATGATETVLATWSPVDSLRIETLGDNIKVYTGSTLLADVDYTSPSRDNDEYGLWQRHTAGDSMRVLKWRSYTTQVPATWSQGSGSSGVLSIPASNQYSNNLGRAVRGAAEWKNEIDTSTWFLYPKLSPAVTLIGWSPGYPDSLFVQVSPNDTFFSSATSTFSDYTMYEVDKYDGTVIRQLDPFYDQDNDALVANPAIGDSTGQYLYSVSHEQPYPGVAFHFVRYDLATGVTTVVHTAPVNTFQGWLEDGREVFGGFRSGWYIYNPDDDTSFEVSFEPYEGKGFNGGIQGWDGKQYVWGGWLNYHVDPSHYKLTAADIAANPGSPNSAGDVVNVGRGIAKAFNEWVRWDLGDAGSVTASRNFVFNPDGLFGPLEGWSAGTNTTTFEFEDTGPVTEDVRAVAADTVTAIGGDPYDWSMVFTDVTVGDGNKLLAHCEMSAWACAAYGRIKVTQRDGSGTVVQEDESAILGTLLEYNQGYYVPGGGVIPAPGFKESVDLQVRRNSAMATIDMTVTWRFAAGPVYEDPTTTHPYGRVRDLSLKSNDGSAPIEYMFNLDSNHPQTYADIVYYEARFSGWTTDAFGIEYLFPTVASPATFAPSRGWVTGAVGEGENSLPSTPPAPTAVSSIFRAATGGYSPLNPSITSLTENWNGTDTYPSGGVSTSGRAWFAWIGSNWGRDSNQLFFNGHNNDVDNHTEAVLIDTGASDGTLHWENVRNVDGTYYSSVAWRYRDEGGGHQGMFYYAYDGRVVKVVVASGGYTATTLTTFSAIPDGATVDVVLSGDTADIYVNGLIVGEVADSYHNTATIHGAACDNAHFARLDNFSWTPASAPGAGKVTLTVPDAVRPRDRMYAFVAVYGALDSTSGFSGLDFLVPPAGWTLQSSHADGAAEQVAVYSRAVPSLEESEFTWKIKGQWSATTRGITGSWGWADPSSPDNPDPAAIVTGGIFSVAGPAGSYVVDVITVDRRPDGSELVSYEFIATTVSGGLAVESFGGTFNELASFSVVDHATGHVYFRWEHLQYYPPFNDFLMVGLSAYSKALQLVDLASYAATPGHGATSYNTPNVTAAVNDVLVYGGTATPDYTTATGTVRLVVDNTADGIKLVLGDKVVTVAGANHATVDQTGSASYYATGIAAIRP